MERDFFHEATITDTNSAMIFFAELKISPYEPDQTYDSIDPITGATTQETIIKGTVIETVCANNVRTLAPRISDNKGEVWYKPYPISIVWPATGTERIEAVLFSIDNIDRIFVDILRRLQFPLRVRIGVGFVTAKDVKRETGVCTTMERRLSQLILEDIIITPETISGKLIVDNVLWRKYPNNHEVYLPTNFPGLWPIGSIPGAAPPVTPYDGSFDHDIDMSRSYNWDGTVAPYQTLVLRFMMPASGNHMLGITVVATGGDVAIWKFRVKGYDYVAGPSSELSTSLYTTQYYSTAWVVPKGKWLYFLATNVTNVTGNFRVQFKNKGY